MLGTFSVLKKTSSFRAIFLMKNSFPDAIGDLTRGYSTGIVTVSNFIKLFVVFDCVQARQGYTLILKECVAWIFCVRDKARINHFTR